MNQNEIEQGLLGVFTACFAKDGVNDLKDAKAHKWDSLSHVMLITKIEDHFEIQFEFSEFDQLISFDAILSSLLTKISK
jgi:acyl carrier protein